MTVDATTMQYPESGSAPPPLPDVIGFVSKHLVNAFRESAWEWSACVTGLARFEESYLLDEPVDTQRKAQHKQTLERLLQLGRLIARVTEDPLFADRKTSEMVRATISCLEDELALWHGPKLPREEADKILAACFPG